MKNNSMQENIICKRLSYKLLDLLSIVFSKSKIKKTPIILEIVYVKSKISKFIIFNMYVYKKLRKHYRFF